MVPDGWKQSQLGDVIAEFRGGGTPSRKQPAFWGGPIPWASVKDLNGGRLTRTVESITQEGLDNSSASVVPAGTVVLATRMAVGKAVTADVPLAINQDLKGLLPEAGLDSAYLQAWLNWHEDAIAALASGTTVKGIRLTSLRSLPFALPPFGEQRKIAAILSAVGDAIAATRKVIEHTKRIKQGLLHTLMTRGIGHTRFKQTEIGQIPETWDLIPLPACEERGLLELGRGQVISAKDMEAVPGDYPVYSSSAKNNGEMGRYGQWMFDEELITWSIDGGGDLFHRPKHRFSVTNVGGYLRLHSSELSYRFVHAALVRQHQKIRFDYQSKAHPSVIRTWYHIPIAPIEEQRQIEGILYGVETTLEQYAALIEEWGYIKRGLMQDLLTGRVRVQPD